MELLIIFEICFQQKELDLTFIELCFHHHIFVNQRWRKKMLCIPSLTFFEGKPSTLSVKKGKIHFHTNIPISIHKWAIINHSALRCLKHDEEILIICSFPFQFFNKWWICHWALNTNVLMCVLCSRCMHLMKTKNKMKRVREWWVCDELHLVNICRKWKGKTT